MELGASHIAEMTLEPRRVVHEGRDVAALLRMGVAYAGEIPLPGGTTLDLDGKRLDLDVAMFLSTDDAGKIVEETWVYDVASAARQMGYSVEDLERIRDEAGLPERAAPT
jgi:predicted ester cyclase